MLRAAAKNHADVTVLVDPADYAAVLAEIDDAGDTSIDTRSRLAAKAFAHTARYDAIVADYLRQRQDFADERVSRISCRCTSTSSSTCAMARTRTSVRRSTADRDQLAHGGNITTARAAGQGAVLQQHRRCGHCHRVRACVRRPGVRHRQARQPVWGGRALHGTLDAYLGAYRTDPTSAFGGIIAFNRALDAVTRACHHRAAIRRGHRGTKRRAGSAGGARRRSPICGCWRLGVRSSARSTRCAMSSSCAASSGGLLLQQRDLAHLDPKPSCSIVSRRRPSRTSWRTCCSPGRWCSSSNPTPSCSRASAPRVGVGAGQMSRVYSTRIAALKAADERLECAEPSWPRMPFFRFATASTLPRSSASSRSSSREARVRDDGGYRGS